MIDELPPADTYRALAETGDSALVDVRTRAEWTFTGIPDVGATGRDLLMVEWVSFPSMAPNPRFMTDLVEAAGGELPGRLFFICRSGARSMAAAQLVAAEAMQRGERRHCTNVAEGFEGDLDAEGHRGRMNGWKVAALPWRQS
ncbi:MAG: rhodanese-like domain-containing protein [Pseudomonadota bacterium]